jgi:hypothetical protein
MAFSLAQQFGILNCLLELWFMTDSVKKFFEFLTTSHIDATEQGFR